MSELKKINNYLIRLRTMANELHVITNDLKDGGNTIEEYDRLRVRENELSWSLIDLYERINLLIDGLDNLSEKDRLDLRRQSDRIMNPIKDKQIRRSI